MQLPVININGSSGEELARQHYEASIHLQEAVKLMGGIVHGRDYQGAPDGALQTAKTEMVNRMEAVLNVSHELTILAQHCSDNSR